MEQVINTHAITRRQYWVEEIRKISGNFGEDSSRLEAEFRTEVKTHGIGVLVDHLRLCGDIPESYAHDSSEEKLYSKYTDILLSESFKALGLKSLVLKERGDSADVEAFGTSYSFVADAKSFRLSRTAKNQKDFKVHAMHGWKRGKLYAMVVCPIYQLPVKSSQIYEQATSLNVCVFTYSHLAVLVSLSMISGANRAEVLLGKVLDSLLAMNPSKDATSYWKQLNSTILTFSADVRELWRKEKQAARESIAVAKEEALTFLSKEREKIMKMGHDEALEELLKVHKIAGRMMVVNSISDNGLLELS